MAVFLDTSFILATKFEDDYHHKKAQILMRRYLKKELGSLYTSSYVFDELTTLILARLRNRKAAIKIGAELINSPRISIIGLSKKNFIDTWKKFQKFSEKGLSFTDCSILVLCHQIKCNYIATFDAHFKGLIGTNLN